MPETKQPSKYARDKMEASIASISRVIELYYASGTPIPHHQMIMALHGIRMLVCASDTSSVREYGYLDDITGADEKLHDHLVETLRKARTE